MIGFLVTMLVVVGAVWMLWLVSEDSNPITLIFNWWDQRHVRRAIKRNYKWNSKIDQQIAHAVRLDEINRLLKNKYYGAGYVSASDIGDHVPRKPINEFDPRNLDVKPWTLSQQQINFFLSLPIFYVLALFVFGALDLFGILQITNGGKVLFASAPVIWFTLRWYFKATGRVDSWKL